MRKIIAFILPLLFLAGTAMSATSAEAADSNQMDEYWCYGDSLSLTFGSDSATIDWKVTDPIGTVLKVSEGPDLDIVVPKEYSLIYVTQTATTGEGSAEKRIAIHLMHFRDESINVVFFDDYQGNPLYRQVFDAYTVCKNREMLNFPEIPVTPSDNQTFGGWYAFIDGEETMVDKSFVVDRNTDRTLNVYAKWLEVYTCTFVDGTSFYGARSYTEGDAVELPEDPVNGDKEFLGWYLDKKCTLPYNEGMILDGDQSLYAKWADNKSQDLFNPILIAPLAILLLLGATFHVKRQKNKGKKRKRYL